MSFVELPYELLLHIISNISVECILTIRQTCRFLYNVTHERAIWFDTLYNLSVNQNVPLPGLGRRSILDLNSIELEELARRTFRYHQNWTSRRPETTQDIIISSKELSCYSGIRTLATVFLPGYNGRYLVTSSFLESSLEPRSIVVHCWDLDEPEAPRSVASLSITTFAAISVNREAGNSAMVSVTRRSTDNVQAEGEPMTSIYSIDLDSRDPTTAFTRLTEFPSPRHPILLHGSRFFSANVANNTIHVINAETGKMICVLYPPKIGSDSILGAIEEFRPLGAVVWDRFFLVFRQHWTHLYELPTSPPSPREEPPQIRPVATYKWPWRIDSLQVAMHDSFPVRHARFTSQPLPADHPPMINILLRYDSWYPWPVNTLHHYTLRPNPEYTGSGNDLPYLYSVQIKPIMETTITSNMRLFTPSDMTIGEYGTALWIDAQSDPDSPQAGDLGQRLAGQALSPNPSQEDRTDNLPGSLLLSSELEGKLDASNSYAAQPIFQIWDTYSEWAKVAVEEKEGRIALGSVEGRIHVMDYA